MTGGEEYQIKEILLKKLLGKELSESEEDTFNSWLENPENKAFYEEHLANRKLFDVTAQVLHLNEPRLDSKMREAFHEKPKRRLLRRIMPYAAAASVLFLVGGLLYRQTRPAAAPRERLAGIKVILPATNRARLKLSNGSVVYLDSTRNGRIATQGNVNIIKTGGELAYSSQRDATQIPTGMNELSVPRAGQFQLRLPDGTHVWLNSETDISYPISFGAERRIKINGEAFLDVAKDDNKPFIVETAHSVSRVLGTTFNVNAYMEDSVEMITVVSGAVSVLSQNNSLTLRPGDQAVERQGKLSLEFPNLQAVTAWRRGFFNFENADARSIMRQISRFYNVSVRYEGEPSGETYDGLISRDLNLSEALSLLNKMDIQATLIDDKTIVVAPKTAPK